MGLQAPAAASRRGGVDIDRAPKQALELVIEARVPEEDHPELRPRGRRRVMP
jgi:succinyl-CoA synthetase beta subunit